MSAYHEGELRGYRRWRVMRHLAKCERCRALYESVVAMLGGLRELRGREPAPDPGLADRVVDRIRRDDDG
jgi:predicted anti-sigma-YlaC factor YlaD